MNKDSYTTRRISLKLDPQAHFTLYFFQRTGMNGYPGYNGAWGSLTESRNTNSSVIVERPHDPNHQSAGQAGKAPFAVELPPGLSCDEFYGHTAVPWNEAGLCGHL